MQGETVFYRILFLLLNVLNCHDCSPEKYFYDYHLPEIYADATDAEKQEILARLKRIKELNIEIEELLKLKKDHQTDDLLNYLLSPKNPLQENQQ